MPKRTDLRSILILGSGPIRIGQACEFDYSGAQACRVLRREGYRVILVNSNPATIMTDPEWADATYLEPLDPETVAEVIERERPDAILPTLGGQTALNLAVELAPLADEFNFELIGADLNAIRRAEDRELFRTTVHGAGIPTPRSIVAHSPDVDFPVPAIVRPAFTLGGTGGGVATSQSDLKRTIEAGLRASPIGQVLVEEYLAGWQEHELEVMCDARGNAVVVCSIENLDPMGVHTGDSWTVAPQQTLPDPVYQQLRDAAFATARAVGVATGGANVQFAVHPETYELRVIEMNPRVSRSSALASKATGFPIAKLAALLAVGYTLDELPNDITQKTTAAFEPALDYVAVKAPRFDFEKFPLAVPRLGAEMRAVGEALGIGRTFPEAFLKAYEGRESSPVAFPRDDDELVARAAEPVPERWDLLLECARRELDLPGIHPYFADRLREIAQFQFNLGVTREVSGPPRRFAVDSCAGEFEAHTPYYYVTHEGEDEGPEPSGRAVIVLGGGPNRIGQAIEFDYCCVHAAQALRKLGYEAVLVNSNPETVSTDYDTSDRLYIEPLVERNVLEVCALEEPVGVAVSFGGQTPLRLAPALAAAGVPLLGDPLAAIDLAEDRGRFAKLAGDLAPEWGVAENAEEARDLAHRLGYPVLVRPHYVIGGRGMHVAHSADELRVEGPCLVDRYLEGALELDVDALCDGESAWVAAVLEHVEPTGVHSGDSACVLPGPSVSEALEVELREVANRIAAGLGARGLVNLQLAVSGGKLFVLEANPRASRTVPFVAKATGVPLVEHAVRLLLDEPLSALGLPERATPSRAWAKEAVFPAERFPGAATRGPEMRSTGEVMAGGATPAEAYARAIRGRPAAPGEAARSARRCKGHHLKAWRYANAVVDEQLDVIEATSTGERVVLATVIDTIRSAPRQPGAKMIVREDGSFTGSVSGGCVEADVVERAKHVFEGGDAHRVHYGVTDGEAWEVGLSCGGEIDVWVEEADPALWREVRAMLDEDGYGTLYTDTTTGEKRLERGVLDATGLREDGVFAEVIEGPLRVVIFGAAAAAEPLCAYGKQLGWRTTVVDARPALATPERVPSADEIVKAWPDEVADRIDERTVVVTLSHEERLDIPAIAEALRRNARYVGAIGAKRTQERRRGALLEQGFTEDDVARIHGPAGLDLGGRDPAQVALAIAAEIVSVTSGGLAKGKAPVAAA